jgi:D-alanyl-D-alanine carboxypeptidase
MSSAYRKTHTCRQQHAALNGSVAHSKRARTTTRRDRRIRAAGLLVVIAAIAGALGYQLPASSSSTAASPIDVHRSASSPRNSSRPISPSTTSSRLDHRGALGEADGALPDGTTVFDDAVPGVANLDPALLGALRQAATDAAGNGVEFVVDSGWRSPEYQEHLLHEAVSKYGSEEEAARWVATPSTSAHVSGDAVDIGPFDAAAWLSEHGAEYGLCQIYSNEPWHYELRPEAIDHGCPPTYADPLHDPRIGRAQRGQSRTRERGAANGRSGPPAAGPSSPPLGRG